jgi:hypothetical protein
LEVSPLSKVIENGTDSAKGYLSELGNLTVSSASQFRSAQESKYYLETGRIVCTVFVLEGAVGTRFAPYIN